MIFKYGHVIASIAKQSIAVFSFVSFFACTDYEAQIDDEYERMVEFRGNPFNSNVVYGELKDSRDGQSYKTVVIGNQVWMAENLNYKTDDSYCFNDNAANCFKYGRLYTWAAAKTVCPSGWHLPSNNEWEYLFTAVGGKSTAGVVLKSQTDWIGGSGSNDFGFSALPAGSFLYLNAYAYFWIASEMNDYGAAYAVWFDYSSDEVLLVEWKNLDSYSVRCLKDDEKNVETSSSSIFVSSSSEENIAGSGAGVEPNPCAMVMGENVDVCPVNGNTSKSSSSTVQSSNSQKIESSSSLFISSSSDEKPASSSASNRIACYKDLSCSEGPASLVSECKEEEGETIMQSCPEGGYACEIPEYEIMMYFYDAQPKESCEFIKSVINM